MMLAGYSVFQVEPSLVTLLLKLTYKIGVEFGIIAEKPQRYTCALHKHKVLNPVKKTFLNREWLTKFKDQQLHNWALREK